MKRFLKTAFVTALMTTLVACSGGGGNTSAPTAAGTDQKKEATETKQQIVLKFSHVTSPDSVKGKAAQKFADLVKEKTDGQVKVEVYPSSQLYGDKDELDALVAGNVQMIAPSVTKMVKLDPRWQYVDMPYLFKDREHALKFFGSDLAKKLMSSDKLASNDILGLTFWENGFKQFTDNKMPLKSKADFAGLKFRAQAGKVLEAQFKALDAGSATIPFGETYAALQQGTVDGQENTFNNIDTQKYQEVQKYLTVSNHGRLDYGIFVNKPFWEGMPEDVRAKVTEALLQATEFERQLANEDNVKSFENLKTSGKMEVYELTEAERAELEKALQPVYDKFKDTITSELIDGIKNLK